LEICQEDLSGEELEANSWCPKWDDPTMIPDTVKKLPRKPWIWRVSGLAVLALAWTPTIGMAQDAPAGWGAPPAATAAEGSAAPVVVTQLGRAAVPVGGLWAFHPGDDLKWAAPGYDDAGWARVRVGETWEQQDFRNLTGFGWYRRKIVVDAGTNPDWALALMLPSVEDAAQVYWNGRLVGSYGRVYPHPVWYGEPQWKELVLGKPGSGVLAIRVWKAPYAYEAFPNMGGLTGVPLMGNAEGLSALRATRISGWSGDSYYNLYSIGVALLSTVVGLLALLAWFRDRKQRMLFWLAVYALRPLALLLVGLSGNSWAVGYGAVGTVISAEDAALWFLLLYLLGLAESRRLVVWTRIFAVTTVVLQLLEGSLQFFDWTRAPGFFLHADVGLTIPCLVLEAYPFVLVGLALRKRLDPARWMVAIFAALSDLYTSADSITGLGERWTHWTIANVIGAPLMTVGGNELSFGTISDSLLLIAVVYAVWRYQAEQSRKQSVLDEEFRNAQELQQVLVPEALPAVPGYRVSSAYRPAQVVGGDFFQILALPAGGGDCATLVVVGDVSGKGLKAAMTVALIVGALRALAETTGDPAKLLEGLNRRLHGRLHGGFATCLAVRLEANGECVAASAGHLAPLLNGEEVLLPGALPLGMVAAAEYATTRIEMRAGDWLTLYTDGLPEARSVEGELYGFERVQALVAVEPDAESVAAAAAAFGQEDDVTVVTVVREADDGRVETAREIAATGGRV
jgi:hypothetical protein